MPASLYNRYISMLIAAMVVWACWNSLFGSSLRRPASAWDCWMPTSVNDATIYLLAPRAMRRNTPHYFTRLSLLSYFGTILCVLVVCYRAFAAIFGTLLM